jgi:hypothetical protein
MSTGFPAVKRFGVDIEFLSAFFDCEFECQASISKPLAKAFESQKGNDLGFVDIGVSEAAQSESIVAQIRGNNVMVVPGWVGVVTFPAGKGNGANPQSAGSFRLKDFQFEAMATEMAANRGRFFWNWNSTVVGWQIFAP